MRQICLSTAISRRTPRRTGGSILSDAIVREGTLATHWGPSGTMMQPTGLPSLYRSLFAPGSLACLSQLHYWSRPSLRVQRRFFDPNGVDLELNQGGPDGARCDGDHGAHPAHSRSTPESLLSRHSALHLVTLFSRVSAIIRGKEGLSARRSTSSPRSSECRILFAAFLRWNSIGTPHGHRKCTGPVQNVGGGREMRCSVPHFQISPPH